MTAEIAILNKTAVALAADSAVTISVGQNQQKVYDSEDKLFELSRRDPIGIMINSNMHFMEAPLPVLIKRYRAGCGGFDRVEDAAMDFLHHLQKFGESASTEIAKRSLQAALSPCLQLFVIEPFQNFKKSYLTKSQTVPIGLKLSVPVY